MSKKPARKVSEKNKGALEENQNVSVLGFSLLSLLARKQRTGYELSRFTSGARSMIFSSSGHSNIYKELAKLATRKLVTFHIVKDARPFDKKVYTLTPLGRDRLLRWVKSAPPRIERRELNVRLHAIWLLKPAEAQALLERQIALANAELQELLQHRQYLQKENDIQLPSPQHPLFGTFANIDLETENRKLIVKWCQWIQQQWSDKPGRAKRNFTKSDQLS